MRYFLDTEFIEDGKTIDLISIGIVAEDGRELYLQNSQADFKRASHWVVQNVLISLDHYPIGNDCEKEPNCSWNNRNEIAYLLKKFIFPEVWGKPEFWGYYSDYDWVVLCQLFGTMLELPDGWPKFCLDIKQYAVYLGNPKLPEQGKGEHNALLDAKWNKVAYDFLVQKDIERHSRLIESSKRG